MAHLVFFEARRSQVGNSLLPWSIPTSVGLFLIFFFFFVVGIRHDAYLFLSLVMTGR